MSSIKLVDAIAANRNGTDNLREQRDRHRRAAAEETRKADALQAEIVARNKMADAMEELQKLMPEGETIKFLVPGSW